MKQTNVYSKIDTDSQIQKRKENLMVTKEMVGGDKLGVWDKHIHTTIYKIDKQ